WFGMHPLEYRKKYIGKIISREIEAKYKKYSPMDIEEAIRRQVKGVYADYVDKLHAKPVIIDINVDDSSAAEDGRIPDIAQIMTREVNEILAEPYNKLMELNERIVSSGDNYIISTGSRYPDTWESMSILVYNFDENVGRSLRKIHTENDLLRIVRNYDEEIEFLVRCNGLSGKFRILKYRLEKDNLMKKITDSINPKDSESRRDILLDKFLASPNVSMSTYTSSDILSVRTTFKGMGAELILIDKI
ncbi:MAG: hypothetical protein ACLRLX_06595, partial [Anaerovoracaceae bacterium]